MLCYNVITESLKRGITDECYPPRWGYNNGSKRGKRSILVLERGKLCKSQMYAYAK